MFHIREERPTGPSQKQTTYPIAEVGNLFHTGRDSKHFGFAGHTISVVMP